jgi:general secretion pathway protein M
VSIGEQLSNMSPREQRLLSLLGLMFGALLVLGGPVYIYMDLAEARERSEEIRTLLRQMNKASPLLAKRKSERTALDVRYAKPAPALATFIESAASANGLEVPESSDRPDVDGDTHVQRTTVVKMRKINLKPLVQMLEKIERSGHPVSISLLTIKKRATGPDLYEVQLGVSAFDKKGSKPADDAKPKKKRDKETEL